jgi:hypothetical protein
MTSDDDFSDALIRLGVAHKITAKEAAKGGGARLPLFDGAHCSTKCPHLTTDGKNCILHVVRLRGLVPVRCAACRKANP